MTPLRRPVDGPQTVAIDAPADVLALERAVPAPAHDARSLQSKAEAWVVGRTLDQQAAEMPKWSARRSLAFMVGATLALWGMIFAAGWLVAQTL
jgi:hypothetical protein